MWGQAWGHAEVRQAGQGRDLLADVLPSEDDAAGLAFEAADVPLACPAERLAVLDLLLAPSAVCKDKEEPMSKAPPGPGTLAVVSHPSLGNPSLNAGFSVTAPT